MTVFQRWGWGDNCSDAERRRSCLHPWLFPSSLMCLSPSCSRLFLPFTFLALLSGSLSSSKETRGGVLSFRAHRRKDLQIFYIFAFSGSVHWITKSSHELDSGICRKIWLAVFFCAPLPDAAVYCLFCQNVFFFNFTWGRSERREDQNI